MTCLNCGSPLNEADRFCPSCGTKNPSISLERREQAASPGNQQPRSTPSSQQIQYRAANRPSEQQTNNPNQHDQFRLMGAYSRSFTTPAIISLVLYLFLWIPGFIANIIYLREANKVKDLTGEAPEGRGCLLVMLVVVTISWALGCVFWLAVFGAAGVGSSTN